jgi:DNA-binding Lrp family transcriptional regulator
MRGTALDEIDQAILSHLQRDGRRAFSAIAEALDVSSNTVRNRIDAMEAAGIISGYCVEINDDRAGIQHHYVFVCSARVSKRERLAEEVRQFPGVIEVLTFMTGSHKVDVVAAGAEKDDMTDLAYVVDELGLTIEREHLIRDHVRQPFSGLRPPEYMTNE